MSRFDVKLICGARELELNDGTTFYIDQDSGFVDNGDTVVLKLDMHESAQQTRRLDRLMEELHWFDQQSVAWFEQMTSAPVWLAVKLDDGVTGDTAIGRGYQYKLISGRQSEKERAISYKLPNRVYQEKLASGMIQALQITLNAHPRPSSAGAPEYPWDVDHDLWVGMARGTIQHNEDGGVLVLPAGTNLIPNSDFENEADRDNGWTNEDAHITDTETTDPNYVWNGHASMKLVEDGDGDKTYTVSLDCDSTDPCTLSCYVRTEDGSAPTSADMQLYYDSAVTTIFTEDTEHAPWYRATAAVTGIDAATNTGVVVKTGKTVYVDSFQFEVSPFVTPYIYGALGRGFAFSGTAHTSSSTRTVGGLYYRNVDSSVPMATPRDQCTFAVWLTAPHDEDGFEADASVWQCGDMHLLWRNGTNVFWFTDGTTTLAVDLDFDEGDELSVFCRWGPTGLLCNVYDEDGTLLASDTDSAYAMPAVGSALWIGSSNVPNAHWGGWIHEVQSWPRELSATEMAARAAAGRGGGELPYLWSVSGTGTIANVYDTVTPYYDTVQLCNVPGDIPAGLKVLLKQTTAGTTPLYVIGGMMRRGVPRTDNPATRNMVGNQFVPYLQAQAGTLGTDAALATDADGSGGAANNVVKVTIANEANIERLALVVAAEPEDMWRSIGSMRLCPRMKTSSADHFELQMQVTTGKHEGPTTPQKPVLADNVYRPFEDEHNYLNIPSWYIDPESLQEVRQGDWASGVDGNYCTIKMFLQAAAASGDISIDGLLMIPQDSEFYGALPDTSSWPENRVLVLDSASPEPGNFVAYDELHERFHDSCDLYGKLFGPVREPVTIVFLVRRSGTGYPWTKSDTITVQMKYRPRYTRLR